MATVIVYGSKSLELEVAETNECLSLANMNEHVLAQFLPFTTFCDSLNNLDNYMLKKTDINHTPPKAATLARSAGINSSTVTGIFLWISVKPGLLIHLSLF